MNNEELTMIVQAEDLNSCPVVILSLCEVPATAKGVSKGMQIYDDFVRLNPTRSFRRWIVPSDVLSIQMDALRPQSLGGDFQNGQTEDL